MHAEHINLVFMGNFLYPKGMAATKRIQHIVDSFKESSNVSASLLLLRQSHTGRDNSSLSGVHAGTPYTTIGHDVAVNWQLPVSLTRYLAGGLRYLRRIRKKGAKNVLYIYGEANLENLAFILYARRAGFKVIFDVVEDHYYVGGDSHLMSRLKHRTSQLIMRRINKLADGVIVISSYLRDKFNDRLEGKVPVHILPISINFDNFREEKSDFGNPVCILYAGSFGDKDAVENLIEAFEEICRKRGDVELVLTGQGVKARMDRIRARIEVSPCADHIRYLGFLDDDEYYKVLNSCDIPCMVRDASAYANAGFPFKLGEYLATGNPTVASRVGDVGDYLVDRQSAMLVEPGSVKDIARVLEYILDHPDKAREIGQAGRRIALENFEKDALGSGLLKFISAI